MAASLEDRVLDFGLDVLDTESTAIYIVSSATEPTTYALATSGAGSLGFKSFGAGSVFGAPAADATGRKVSSAAVTDGTIVTSGTAAWWAIVAAASSLHAHGSLASNQVVTAGNTFTLASFDIIVRRS
jgi:hypothetical protein